MQQALQEPQEPLGLQVPLGQLEQLGWPGPQGLLEQWGQSDQQVLA